MFQKLISLTPIAIDREIDQILSTMPLNLSQRFTTVPTLKESIIQGVFHQYFGNVTSNLEHSDIAGSGRGMRYPYIQYEQLQFLVRTTLFNALPQALMDGSELDLV